MEIHKLDVTTGENYTDFVRAYATLLDKQLAAYEQLAQDPNELGIVAQQLPALISCVNTAGYLRGQDGMFLNFRPRTENQKEFYSYEDGFEKRLRSLIEIVLNSDKKEYYLSRLESYYVTVRSNKPGTIL